jgi:hypothetical protein
MARGIVNSRAVVRASHEVAAFGGRDQPSDGRRGDHGNVTRAHFRRQHAVPLTIYAVGPAARRGNAADYQVWRRDNHVPSTTSGRWTK